MSGRGRGWGRPVVATKPWDAGEVPLVASHQDPIEREHRRGDSQIEGPDPDLLGEQPLVQVARLGIEVKQLSLPVVVHGRAQGSVARSQPGATRRTADYLQSASQLFFDGDDGDRQVGRSGRGKMLEDGRVIPLCQRDVVCVEDVETHFSLVSASISRR